mgnify:CR=1 FL=1
MTSRNLFFKLMKEDLKRRLWAIGFFGSGAVFCDADGGSHGDRRDRKPVQAMADLRNRIREYGAGDTAPDEDPAACR